MSANGESSEHGRVACPKCANRAMRRDNRKGFLEKVVFPWFHLYPWECAQCQNRTLFKMRGNHKKPTDQ